LSLIHLMSNTAACPLLYRHSPPRVEDTPSGWRREPRTPRHVGSLSCQSRPHHRGEVTWVTAYAGMTSIGRVSYTSPISLGPALTASQICKSMVDIMSALAVQQLL